jgi:hypothetical protein
LTGRSRRERRSTPFANREAPRPHHHARRPKGGRLLPRVTEPATAGEGNPWRGPDSAAALAHRHDARARPQSRAARTWATSLAAPQSGRQSRPHHLARSPSTVHRNARRPKGGPTVATVTEPALRVRETRGEASSRGPAPAAPRACAATPGGATWATGWLAAKRATDQASPHPPYRLHHLRAKPHRSFPHARRPEGGRPLPRVTEPALRVRETRGEAPIRATRRPSAQGSPAKPGSARWATRLVRPEAGDRSGTTTIPREAPSTPPPRTPPKGRTTVATGDRTRSAGEGNPWRGPDSRARTPVTSRARPQSRAAPHGLPSGSPQSGRQIRHHPIRAKPIDPTTTHAAQRADDCCHG